MKLRIFLSFYLLLTFIQLKAQMHNGLFGNEWINYNQTYYKIKVAQDGFYRISSTTLTNAGINLLAANPSHFQLYHMGQQVPVYVHLNNGAIDYVEFYGKKNNGALDENLYNVAAQHFNPLYSAITDTAAYFLTSSVLTPSFQFQNANNNLSNLPTKEAFYLHKSENIQSQNWQKGKDYSITGVILNKPSFEYGEGYGSNRSSSINLSLTTDQLNSTGPVATARIRSYAVGDIAHGVDIRIGTNPSLYSLNFGGDSVMTHSFTIPLNQISNTTTLRVLSNGGGNDKNSVSFAEIIYPRNFNFGGNSVFSFQIGPGNRKYIEVSNFNGTNGFSQNIYLYDLTTGRRVNCFWDGLRVLFDLPASTQTRDLVLVNFSAPNTTNQVAQLETINFINPSANASANYIILYHKNLTTSSSGLNPITEYAGYRASTGFNPITIEISEIANQFGYGIEKHPVAIKNFAQYVKANWSNPQYLFLIGKGRLYTAVRNFNTYDNLIPAFGSPPSDNLMVAPLGSDVPALPIGRLAAYTGDQVLTYLQKIRDTEAQRNAPQTLADRGWMKNVVHLGGGDDNSQQSIIRSALTNMEGIIEGSDYGAQVHSFFKTSTNPIQAAQSAFLDSLINNGVSLLTFFGHSSPNSFDFNLDRPENYQNTGKYPLIISLGCYSGTIFDDGQFISEKFIFEPNAGAAGFLASVGASSLVSLSNFSIGLYNNITDRDYNKGIPKAIQSTIQNLENSGAYLDALQMATQYMVYHGDPAFTLNTTERPDYFIDASCVSHSPNQVSTVDQSFSLSLDVYNLGKGIDTIFNIEINRTTPDGQFGFVSRQRFNAPHFKNTYTFSIPVGGSANQGINLFHIKVDSEEEIEEKPNPSAENNNEILNYAVQIISDDIIPVFPPDFGIVGTQPITLTATAGSGNILSQTYRMQIDSTAYFNSPLLKDTQFVQAGGILNWTPPITYMDSTVYYWRISLDSTNASIGYNWLERSFIFLDSSSTGWNQSHFFQFEKDQLSNFNFSEPSRRFEYVNTFQEISVTNGFTPNPLHPEQLKLSFNNVLLDKCRCSNNRGTYVTVIDSASANVWVLPGGTSRYGAINCDPAQRDAYAFLFETDNPLRQADLNNFLQDSIPDGSYILIYTLNDADADTWNSSLSNYILSQGSTLFTGLQQNLGGLPWAFYYQKNRPGFAYRAENLGANTNDIIQLSGLIPGNWNDGKIVSTIIGPCQNWQTLKWSDFDLDPHDISYLKVYGIDSMQVNKALLIDQLTQKDTLLSQIDAQVFPYLQLEWHCKDSVNRSSPQLKYWRILADLSPEAAVRPDIYTFSTADTVERGQDFTYEVMLANISSMPMDSMLVKFQLNNQTPVYKRLGPLAAGDTLRSTPFTVNTLGLSGLQTISIEINPDNDQRELYHFNNYASTQFYVRTDRLNPLLDVSFDGVKIMNGDLISGESEIIVSLRDENRWLALRDINDFRLVLRNPNFSTGETELNSNEPVVKNFQFFPADSNLLQQENRAEIQCKLDLPWDGKYTLFVSAKDRSGNNSGNLDYSVDFEVINKSMITEVLNYPNPFTTKTHFVFTLTGREIPEQIKIQIYTVSGKLVREIDETELGPIHIGVNKTSFAWDGTDQFGDRLANGVYLYRVISKLNKEDLQEMEIYQNKASNFFKDGFGKMYLMR